MKLVMFLTSFLLSFNGKVSASPSNYDNKEINCIARAVYFEARGSSAQGQAAVGQVIRNRVKSDKFKSTYCGVVYQKGQFSWTQYKNLKIKDQESWNNAKKIATVTYYFGWPYELVKDALFFHSGKKPYWAKAYEKTVKIDGHRFYKIKS